MTSGRSRPLGQLRDYAGGLVMFATEILIVLGLAFTGWLFSLLILAFF
ncbi:MAG: hypothetical protein PVF87_02205 [Acidimicrobiia bacterium]